LKDSRFVEKGIRINYDVFLDFGNIFVECAASSVNGSILLTIPSDYTWMLGAGSVGKNQYGAIGIVDKKSGDEMVAVVISDGRKIGDALRRCAVQRLGADW